MISKIFAIVKIIGSLFTLAATGTFTYIAATGLNSEDFLGMMTISGFTVICCSYLIYGAIMDVRALPMKRSLLVWIGFVACTLSLIAVGYYWGWPEKISLGLPLLLILVRDFILLRSKSQQFPNERTLFEGPR